MKDRRSKTVIQLHRDRSKIGVAVKAGKTEVIKSKTGKPRVISVDQKKPEKKRKKIPYKKIRKIACTVIGAELVILAGFFAWKNLPVAIAISDEDACYLKNEKEADAVMDLLVDENLPDGTELYTKTINHNMKIHRILGLDKDFKTAEEAEELIWNDYIETDKSSVSTQSTEVQTWDYVPEPEYIQDDTMMAGFSRVEDEGKKGEQKVTMLYLVRNGELADEKIIEREITDEGSPAVIYKGTVGLPEGEDWRTYEGLPVFNSGEELVEFSKNYLGLRYVYGGNSLETGVDCVTFIIQIYKKFGINLPHTFKGLASGGISVPLSEARPGDIIVYNEHVALYMGNGKIIHATRGKSWNVHISNVNYSKKRHVKSVRRYIP